MTSAAGLLVISTSSPALSLALGDAAGQLAAHRHLAIGRGHAEALVPAIAGLLGSHRPAAIVVDVGPGSFTGIRIGIAAARALALAWGVPVTGCTAFALTAAAAFAARPGLPAVLALVDAGRGQVVGADVSAAFDEAPPRFLTAGDVPAGAVVAGAGALLLPGHAGDVIADGLPDAAMALLLPPTARALAPTALYARPADAVSPG